MTKRSLYLSREPNYHFTLLYFTLPYLRYEQMSVMKTLVDPRFSVMIVIVRSQPTMPYNTIQMMVVTGPYGGVSL